jgi:hypothetical protein
VTRAGHGAVVVQNHVHGLIPRSLLMASTPKKQIRVVMSEPMYQQIKRYSGGNQTRFILESVQERLRGFEQQELEAELAEGYRVRAQEHQEWVATVSPLYREVLGPEAEEA